MAQPNSAAGPNPIWVIGPQFCAPYPVELVIDKNPLSISHGKFIVTDGKGNFLFKVKKIPLKLHDHRVVIDAAGNHVVTLRQKILTAHSRWEVYRGDSSSNPNDLLFSARTVHTIQLRTRLQVFLARNLSEEISDFRVEGSWLESSCVIHAGESTTNVIAEMQKKRSVESVLLGKDKFMVRVCPHVDNAFIVALIVILDEINN